MTKFPRTSDVRSIGRTGTLDQLSEAPIFVIGVSRSGTTWVYDMLTAHPQVGGILESWLFSAVNGVGSLFSSAHWPHRSVGLGRFLTRELLLGHVRGFAAGIMQLALEPHHRYLVEKSPAHLYTVPLISGLFPAARFIHVLRDGRDVCVSIRAATRSWMPEWKKNQGRSTWVSAKTWKNAVRRAQRDGRALGNRWLEVRYESIHADPAAGVRLLYEFCKIPYTPDLVETVLDTTDFNKNYREDERRFRRAGRVGDWQTHFSVVDAIVFNLAAGDLLKELGYEKSRCWRPSYTRAGKCL